MKIRDITLADIRAGKNWRLLTSEDERWFDAPMEEWGPLVEAERFSLEDHVVYSGLVAYSCGRVQAIVQIKTVGDLDYGGDFCEFVDGGWRQLGLVPNPNAEPGREYIANPLSVDESFSTDEYREEHRKGFLEHAGKL
jgi:hypothetical protein